MKISRAISPLYILIVLFLGLPSAAIAYEFKQLTTMESYSDQTGWSGTMLTSDDAGNLYYAFKNPSNKIEVGKWTAATGLKETAVINPLQASNDAHEMLAIAVDLNGYLHVMGPHHQNEMDYLVSNLPYSVTGGFTRQVTSSSNVVRGLNVGTTKDNGERAITYASFFYDNDYNPWIHFRFRVSPDGYKMQSQAAQLARYNSNTGLWELIGGNTNPEYEPTVNISFPNPKIPSFIWSTKTQTNQLDNAYQKWGDRQHIDHTGRIHIAEAHFDKNGGDGNAGGYGNDIIYFYSDDNGETWHTANGSTVADSPIVVPGNHHASMYVKTNRPDYDFSYVTAGRAADGKPVVAYSSKDGPESWRYSKWNGNNWVETDSGFKAPAGDLKIDSHGVWYIAANSFVKTSTDNGATWKTYSHGLPSSSRALRIDERYFKKTNKLRFMVRPSGDATVTFMEFVSDEWSPPGNPGDEDAPPLPPTASVQ